MCGRWKHGCPCIPEEPDNEAFTYWCHWHRRLYQDADSLCPQCISQFGMLAIGGPYIPIYMENESN